MQRKPLLVSWKQLKELGWPYSRAQTWRLMQEKVQVTRKAPGLKRRVAEEIPNPRRFPACRKLGPYRNSHPVWLLSDVLDYFRAFGLEVPQNYSFE